MKKNKNRKDKYEYENIVEGSWNSCRASDGWEEMDAITEKVKKAGILFGTHEEIIKITKYRRNVTPVKLRITTLVDLPRWEAEQIKEEWTEPIFVKKEIINVEEL